MRMWLLIAIATIGVLALPATSASAKACKGSKVAVKAGKKRTCLPFAKVFPAPKAADLRLAYLQQALKFDPAKALKGKKRKRASTLQSGFGAAGKRAQKKILGLLPKALAFFDRKRSSAGSSALNPGPALASANCGVGQAGEKGSLGGSSTVGMLGDNGMFIETNAGHGLRIRVTFFSCGGVNSFRVPECPTAAGAVEAPPASGDFSATTEIWEGSQLKSRNSSRFEDQSKARGKVGPDAKLKYVDVEHKQVVLIVASGGIVIRSGVTRKVRIDMPGGNFDPDSAAVLYSGDWIGANLGAEGFARSAKGAIDSYKQAEPRWSNFDRKPYCAQAIFSPATDTIKVKREESRQLGIYAKARDGGRATEARWEFLNQSNAAFSPVSSQEPSPNIQYTVTKTPQGNEVKVTAKFTSTAGVGEDSWKQPIEGALPERFAITFSGSASYDASEVGTGGGTANWNGNAELLEIPSPYPPGTFPYQFAMYKLATGSITYSYSGALGDCSATASGPIDLAAQPDLVGGVVLGIYDKTPREYNIFLGMPLTPEAEVPGQLEGCKDPEDNGPIDFSPGIGAPLLVNAPLPGGPVGEDWSFSGTGSGDLPGSPEQTWHWNGSPIP